MLLLFVELATVISELRRATCIYSADLMSATDRTTLQDASAALQCNINISVRSFQEFFRQPSRSENLYLPSMMQGRKYMMADWYRKASNVMGAGME